MDINAIEKLRMDGINYDVVTHEVGPLGIRDQANIDFANTTINLCNCKPAIWLQQLWHEIMHHIANYRLNADLSEEQIDAIATGINSILLDNPNLPMEVWQVAVSGQFTIEDDTDDDERDDETDGSDE